MSIRPWAIVFVSSLLIIPSCSPSPEKLGEQFLSLLQQQKFSEAASLATAETAGLILFMEEMLSASFETGELLDLPLPPSNEDIVLISTNEEENYRILEYEAGNQQFILYTIEIDGRLKIHLPRSSW